MRLDQRSVKKLEGILEQELSCYSQYLALLSQEQMSVVGLKADKVASFSQKRSEVVNRITELRDKRLAIVVEFTGAGEQRLSDLIREACAPSDARKLDKLINQIKAIVKVVESKSREFNQVLNFSLGLVNGEISLLWSASQPVSRVYNSFGAVNEATQPSAPRAGSLLGEA